MSISDSPYTYLTTPASSEIIARIAGEAARTGESVTECAARLLAMAAKPLPLPGEDEEPQPETDA